LGLNFRELLFLGLDLALIDAGSANIQKQEGQDSPQIQLY